MDVRDDRLVTSSNLQYDLSDVVVGKSRVMLGVRAYDARWPSVYATRQVRSFERGLLEVRGDIGWSLVWEVSRSWAVLARWWSLQPVADRL